MEGKLELLIVFLPIFAIYISPIPGVDLGTFLSVVFFTLYILKRRSITVRHNGAFWIIIIYTLIDTIAMLSFSSVRYSSATSIYFRLFRFIFLMVAFIGIDMSEEFDMKRFLRILRAITLFVALYAIAQQLFFRVTGMKLVNVFGRTKQGVVFDPLLGKYQDTYRPPSIFLEPSSVTYYVVPFLCFCLLSDEYSKVFEKKNEVIDALVISVGVIATTSGLGLASVVIVWLLWIAKILRNRNGRRFFIAIILLAASTIALRTSSLINYIIERIFTTSEMSAIDARTTGYYIWDSLTAFHKVFGTGFGNYDETIYYTSIADILFCNGIVGLLLVFVFYMQCYHYGSTYQKGLVYLSFVLMIGGGIYSATYLCFYLPLLMYDFPDYEGSNRLMVQENRRQSRYIRNSRC